MSESDRVENERDWVRARTTSENEFERERERFERQRKQRSVRSIELKTREIGRGVERVKKRQRERDSEKKVGIE